MDLVAFNLDQNANLIMLKSF